MVFPDCRRRQQQKNPALPGFFVAGACGNQETPPQRRRVRREESIEKCTFISQEQACPRTGGLLETPSRASPLLHCALRVSAVNETYQAACRL
jgi:hypothetical protein